MQCARFIFTTGPKTSIFKKIVSWTISATTRVPTDFGSFSHCALLIGDRTVIDSTPKVGVQERTLTDLELEGARICEVKNLSAKDAETVARLLIDTNYDEETAHHHILDTLKLFDSDRKSKRNNLKNLNCVEFSLLILHQNGIRATNLRSSDWYTMRPNHIANLGCMHWIN